MYETCDYKLQTTTIMSILKLHFSYPDNAPGLLPEEENGNGGSAVELPGENNEAPAGRRSENPRVGRATPPSSSALLLWKGRGSTMSAITNERV